MYCKEAYEDFIIDYAYYQYRQIKEKKQLAPDWLGFT